MDSKSLFDEDSLDEVREEVSNEIGRFIKTTGEQISFTNTTHTTQKEEPEYIFTSKFYEKAEGLGLNESDALDVYHTGVERGEDSLIRVYNGYEIGIEYEIDPQSGKPVITSIWKRDTA